MNREDLEAIHGQLTLLEFAIQDWTETDLVESAQLALEEADALCLVLRRYVDQRKEKDNGYRIQSCDADRQPGEGSQDQ